VYIISYLVVVFDTVCNAACQMKISMLMPGDVYVRTPARSPSQTKSHNHVLEFLQYRAKVQTKKDDYASAKRVD
jgi:hypothetical protein